jgi:cell division protein FtsL
MVFMTNEEKIQKKKAEIQKLESKVKEEQKKINQLKNEIVELESLEIKGIIEELNIPFDEFKKRLRELNINP